MKIERRDIVEDQFSRSVVYGATIYFAGLVPTDVQQDIRGQSAQVLSKLENLLAEAGSSKSHLLSVIVYLKTFDDYDGFKLAYANWIDVGNLPARATVSATMRDSRILLEIVAIAAVADL